jgi:hypothetical protein
VVSWITVFVLIYLGRRYMGWRVWAGLLLIMNVLTNRQQQAPRYPDLPANRWPLAVLGAVMLILTFTTSPLTWH